MIIDTKTVCFFTRKTHKTTIKNNADTAKNPPYQMGGGRYQYYFYSAVPNKRNRMQSNEVKWSAWREWTKLNRSCNLKLSNIFSGVLVLFHVRSTRNEAGTIRNVVWLIAVGFGFGNERRNGMQRNEIA